MKKIWNNMLFKKIFLFISFTILMTTIYYKVIPIMNNYGTEAFVELDFTKTKRFKEIFERQIQSLESVIDSSFEIDSFNNEIFTSFNRTNTNMEYILDIEKTNGETMLLSNISYSNEELKNIMNNFSSSKRYYICNLNSIAKTNLDYLKHYQFHADQEKFKKLNVYIRIDEFYSEDYLKSLKDTYEDFSYHVKELGAICIISIVICIVLIISITKNLDNTKKNSFFDNLYIEEIIVIIGTITIEGIRLIEGNSYTAILPNYIKWIIYLVSYFTLTEIYFSIIRKIKNKDRNNLFIVPKILEYMKYIYMPIIIYSVLSIGIYIFTNRISINYYIGTFDKAVIILAYTIILLHFIKLKIELIQINDQIEKISQGDMNIQIVPRNKTFNKLAENINSIKKGMKDSIDEKVKSERLKTDLITNVSHDLKTPLTSIINYIYLLEKEKIENEKAKNYIKVLKDKSKKLKSLTEDLIEASKISSGNESINLEKLNFSEMVLQANGEFAEKFEEKNLVTISNIEREEIIVNLDSKKMWRVLENIYNNIYKYSLSGTRVYVDLIQKNKEVIFTIKNISKDELNVSPDELMQRFVRGDKSRNSSGNGLGLSISKDLVTLQNGIFNIDIQGDLFIVKIVFEVGKSC